MKNKSKQSFALRIFIAFIFAFLFISPIAWAAEPPAVDAASYVLMSADTGEILAKSNADASRFPASTTKLMTMTLIR